MDYLDRFDDYKKKHCVELSTKDKLRTGYTNKNQLRQGLNMLRKDKNVSLDDTKLMSLLYPDTRETISMGQKISSGADQEFVIYDTPIADNSLSGSYVSSLSPAPSSLTKWFDGPTEGSTEKEQSIQDRFDSGEINEEEYEQLNKELEEASSREATPFQFDEGSSPIQRQRSLDPSPPESSPRGGRRAGAGRPSREEQRIRAIEGSEIRDQRAVNSVLDDIIGELEDDEY